MKILHQELFISFDQKKDQYTESNHQYHNLRVYVDDWDATLLKAFEISRKIILPSPELSIDCQICSLKTINRSAVARKPRRL